MSAPESHHSGLPDGAVPIYADDPSLPPGATSGLADLMGSLEEKVHEMAREAGNAPKTFYEDVQAFGAAVDWSEWWIQALLAGHAVLWVVALSTRKSFNFQVALFFLICALVWASETLNTLAHRSWRSFSTQDYFDSAGFFIAVMYSGPLLLLAMLQMMNFLALSAELLVVVKKNELKQQREQKADAEAERPGGAVAEGSGAKGTGKRPAGSGKTRGKAKVP